ncbi:hypothetical protein ACJBU6_02386 [Exserohilum turcicum]
MAQVVAPSSQASTAPYAQQNAPHGKKRPADSSLENEQRLSKRFDLLNLVDSNGTRLYIPVAGSLEGAHAHAHAHARGLPGQPIAGADPLAFVSSSRPPRSRRPRAPPTDADGMEVEDTPHRVYISDLSAELSDIESDEEKPIFLSDIEKHLSKIPRHVLLGPEPKPTMHNQMVLYNVPSSLTVPQEQDNVRKAIVETRQRIRDRQANPVTEPPGVFAANTTCTTTLHTPPALPRTSTTPNTTTTMMTDDIPPAHDNSTVDAMDID